MNGRGKTKPYTMDDYIKDREQSWGKTATGSPMQAPKSSTGGFTVSKFTPPLPLGAISLQKQAMERSNQAAGTVTAPSVGAPSVNVGSGAPEGGTVGAVPLTDVDVYKYQMDQARQKVYDVLNRKFKYNAKDSPLYTIMQQQYEREAERAAGRAYSSAVANTGGYGSSYATLAGEEARRQVMEGMDEAQYELYQAARQEFMDERQSAVDWYSQARQMYLDKLSDEEYRKKLEAEAGKTMSDSTYKLLIEASTNGWYKGDNENLLRAKLETYKAGDPGIDVDAIMGHLKREYDAWQADTEAMTEKDVEADPERVQTFYGAAYEVWDGTNEETVRTALKNQGATEAEIDATVEMLKTDTDSQTNDAIKLFETEPTVSEAEDIMAEAKLNGTADKYIEKVSGTLSQSIMEAMDKPAVGYKVLGVDPAAWDEVSDEDKDGMLLDAAETAYKNGAMTVEDFKKVVTKNAMNSLELNRGRFWTMDRFKGVMATVNGILSLSDDKTVTKGFAEDVIDKIVKDPTVQEAMDFIMDEYRVNEKLGIDGLFTGITMLNKAEEDAAGEILKAMYRTGVKKNEKADEIFDSATNRSSTNGYENPASKKKRWN